MKTRTMLAIGFSAFALTAATLGASSLGMIASAASAENPKHAASEAVKARAALAKRDAAKAVAFAENAVAFAPHDAQYRALLGQAYMLAGRFASARQALTDALSLDSTNPHVALNLSLAQIAQGDWSGARNTLEDHADIPVSDRGLAFALAGDPGKAVDLLMPAVHAADASPKTRQNLALSLALAGRWAEAKAVASLDMAPDQVDTRIMQWAAFSKPTNAYDQVASLLNVRAVADQGQPAQLALVQPVSNVAVAAAPSPAPVAETPAKVSVATDPVPAGASAFLPAETKTVVAPAAPVAAAPKAEPAPIAGTTPQVVFGPRQEVVQPIPVSQAVAPKAAKAAARVASAPAKDIAPAKAAPSAKTPVRVADKPAPVATTKGKFVVQLGAYQSAAIAHDSWKRTAHQVPAVAKFQPQTAQVKTKAGVFYRLSVGGFARNDADSLCNAVKTSGGACFVRVQAGDQVASWSHGGGEVASR